MVLLREQYPWIPEGYSAVLLQSSFSGNTKELAKFLWSQTRKPAKSCYTDNSLADLDKQTACEEAIPENHYKHQ